MTASAAETLPASAMLDAALACARRGWRIVPVYGIAQDGGCTCGKAACDNTGKHPWLADWSNKATTNEVTIRGWFRQRPRSNIGVATGRSSGVFVLDKDGEEGARSLDALQMEHGLLPPTLTVTTGGGNQHFYFAYPADMTVPTNAGEIAPGVDLRGEGGQAVLPPSLHRSGQPYQWVDELDDVVPAPGWLLEEIAQLKRTGARTITTGGAGDDGAPIPEGGRNDALAAIAGRMRWAGLKTDQVVDALQRVNLERCQPPLPEDEVATIAQSIGRYPAGDGAEKVSAGTSTLRAAERKPLMFRSAREIAETVAEEPDWLLYGYIAEGAITEIDGKIKSAGKTTLLTHLCRAILDGETFLNRPTKKTPIVYLTEQSPATFLQALKRADLLDRDDFRVLFWHDTIGTKWPEIVAEARLETKRIGARVLAVDTLSQFSGVKGDAENNSGAALEAMEPLQEAAAADRLAIIALRHDRKSGGDVGDSGRGSSAFSGAVDVVLQLRRPEGQSRPGVRVINALSRYDETPETLVIELVDGAYVALGDAEAVATQEARGEILKAAPTDEGTALREPDLLAAAGVKRTVGQDVLREHVTAGLIVRIGGGKRGDPYRYWRPIEEGEKLSAATPVVPAERNGHYPESGGKLSAAPKVEVPAERNDDDRASPLTEPVLVDEGVAFLSAGTSSLGAAERNGATQEDLFEMPGPEDPGRFLYQ